MKLVVKISCNHIFYLDISMKTEWRKAAEVCQSQTTDRIGEKVIASYVSLRNLFFVDVVSCIFIPDPRTYEKANFQRLERHCRVWKEVYLVPPAIDCLYSFWPDYYHYGDGFVMVHLQVEK